MTDTSNTSSMLNISNTPDASNTSDLVADYAWLYARKRAGRERRPAQMAELLTRWGRPDANFDSIRVVGTNGKGSTCAMLEAGLLTAKQCVGRFSSPHVQHFEERIRLDGVSILTEQTAQFIEWAKKMIPDEPFFEQTLLLACQVFSAAEVDWAIMEAGVGGIQDSTQALQNVRAVLLTNVHLDHQSVLGHTIAEITRDKASAALPEVPFITTAQGEALELAQEIAEQKGAIFYAPHTHPELFALPQSPSLLGSHQAQNASLAVATLRLLEPMLKPKTQPKAESTTEPKAEQNATNSCIAALNARIPARLERFDIPTSATSTKTVWLDGAHNPRGSEVLAQTLQNTSAQNIDVLLFGHLERREVETTLAPLLPLTSKRFFTCPDAEEAENGDVHSLEQRLEQQYQGYRGQIIPQPEEALQQALATVPEGGQLLITGSLYLAGRLREQLLTMTQSNSNSA